MSWLSYNNGLFDSSDFDYFKYGTSGNNTLSGYNGTDDFLEGNRGSDTLYGGSGNDVLVGTDPDYYNAGAGEYDRLNGGWGYDTFVLGDSYEAYYQGSGYAIIEDFNQAMDMIAVNGDVDYQYRTTYVSGVGNSSTLDTVLETTNGDWIAVFQDTTVDLNSNDFYFL